MENYSYNSYPESGGSSPRSREIDFENPPPWEDHQPAGNNSSSSNYKVKLMCSYGGKIQPRPHDNQLAYIGGETKILAVDRSIKFSVLVTKLSALCDADVCFKYQLPGEDLDALISVTNDDDLDHMMNEYDRLYRASPKPARLRLFLFPGSVQSPSLTPARSFGSIDGRSERERFVDALNSGSVASTPPPSASPALGNADFLFGSEKGVAPVVVSKVRDLPIADPDVVAIGDDRIGIGADPIQKHIQDLRRLRIAEEQQQQQTVYRRQIDDHMTTGGYTGDYYVQRTLTTDKVVSVPSPAPGYQISGGFTAASTISADQQPVYMVPAQSSMYHAPMPRPVTGPIGHGHGQGQGQGHGYYAVQRMPTEVYRDPPLYNNAMQQPPVQSVPTQQPNKIGTHPEAVRMVQSTTGMADYAQVAYDNGVGRHVYYAPQGTIMTPQPQPQPQPQQTTQHYHHAMAAAAAPQQAALNQGGGKVVGPSKISQGSI